MLIRVSAPAHTHILDMRVSVYLSVCALMGMCMRACMRACLCVCTCACRFWHPAQIFEHSRRLREEAVRKGSPLVRDILFHRARLFKRLHLLAAQGQGVMEVREREREKECVCV